MSYTLLARYPTFHRFCMDRIVRYHTSNIPSIDESHHVATEFIARPFLYPAPSSMPVQVTWHPSICRWFSIRIEFCARSDELLARCVPPKEDGGQVEVRQISH